MANYKRILVKISGESLSDGKSPIANSSAKNLALQLKKIASTGVQLGIVIGGGNFWRGRTSEDMDRSVADSIGMLATVMNGLALGQSLAACGVKNKVFTSLQMDKVAEFYTFEKASRAFEEGNVVIFVGGTGAPYFSTDTTLSLKACEMHADAIFFMKAVDGVYSADPSVDPTAVKYDEITFDKIITDNLKVMDLTAMAMCKEYGMTAVALSKDEPDGILRVLNGEKLGTIIK